MAQNFWTAIFAWTTCFVLTIVVSLATKAHDEESLVGLVHSLTPRLEAAYSAWWRSPVFAAIVVLAGAITLNLIFL
jgi:SSS family solute:Na+ symporter